MASWLLAVMMCAAANGSSDCRLIHFTAAWCEPCQQVRPALDRLQQEGWVVEVVDVDRELQLVQQYHIENLPTIVIVCRDQEVDRMVGAAPYEQIHQRAKRAAARNQNGPPDTTDTPLRSIANQTRPIVRGQSPSVAGFPLLASASPGAQRQNLQNAHSFSAPAPSAAQPTDARDNSSLSAEQAIARAAAATVRIRVDEANTTAYGTGTIIDVHGQEALILTCGHLFREMQPNSQLTVDLFPGTAQEVNLPSQLIDFKAEGEDIGLISFRIPIPIEPVPILSRAGPLQVGQQVFSFGCDHGGSPTRRDTRIVSINRYLGADNIEISGAPAVGRSGGGLFDAQGCLIGVCNAADATDDEGIYAAAEVVYSQIKRLGLSHLFEQAPPGAASNVQLVSSQTILPTEAPLVQRDVQREPGNEFSSNSASLVWPDESVAASSPANASPAASSDVRQLICIVRDSGGRDSVVTIDAPPAQLLQLIQQSVRN